jgi:hypothetical protein
LHADGVLAVLEHWCEEEGIAARPVVVVDVCLRTVGCDKLNEGVETASGCAMNVDPCNLPGDAVKRNVVSLRSWIHRISDSTFSQTLH